MRRDLPTAPKPITRSALLLFVAILAWQPAWEVAAARMQVEGLDGPARIMRDSQGVPHIFAATDQDASFLMGWVHAEDRFFQMDLLRRVFSGTSAELLGSPALASDVQLRTLGLRRAAELTWRESPRALKVWLRAYANGVNAYRRAHDLPPEYSALEIGSRDVPPWTPVDSLVMGKGLAFGLSFDLDDIDRTVNLIAHQMAGAAGGFDGTALFFEDTFRSAPFDPTTSIPLGSLQPVPGAAPATQAVDNQVLASARRLGQVVSAQTVELASGYLDKVSQVPSLAFALSRNEVDRGSNWWLIGSDNSTSGKPMLANDPHLALDSPSTFYEVHLLVFDPNRNTPMSANGVSFAGAPSLAQGCNRVLCWGSTVNPMDVTDVYQEQLVLDPDTGLPSHTIFDGQLEPLKIIPQTFLFNLIGDGVSGNLQTADIGPLDGGVTLVVPRRNGGPIVAVDTSNPAQVTALSVQYTGWGATFELEAFRRWLRAKSITEFREDLQFFDVGSQNWGVADVHGNIAYFTSAEMPIREDLQNLNQPDGGIPPFFIRDGTHTLHHEWLPVEHPQSRQALNYEILPFQEMPQSVNPAAGFIINANNDPVGTTLDNNPLNQVRPGGGLYYLSPGYVSLRAGRIHRLIEQGLADGGTLSLEDMMRIQGNNQLLDAEIATPFLFTAFSNAIEDGAPASLAALGTDPGVAEAIGRLTDWDFSTPTGIAEGYDPGDDPTHLPVPSASEIDYSVSATIYSVWRSRMIANTVDSTLASVGLEGFRPGSRQAWSAAIRLLRVFGENQGLGVSGLKFFPQAPDSADPDVARDLVILTSLAEALDLLAGEAFAEAFGGSTDLEDYRWGRLHRIVFDHPLGGPFSIPGGGGFSNLSPELPGIPRSGGFEAVDASSHNARAASSNGFQFGSGPARRFVGQLSREGIEAYQVIPGGQSGSPASLFQANQLHLWLTNHYHPLLLRSGDVRADRIRQDVLIPR
ncbi:MAG: penicillin acylase family protein [Deltaproteobacteria bacterium]|nr:penicillin acylase family protein [Deltaproteobacteria bacterium]